MTHRPLYTLLVTLAFLLVASTVYAAPPQRPDYALDMARTGVSVPAPRGAGQVLVTLSSKSPTFVRPFNSGTPIAYQLPTQLQITSTSTTVTVGCWSQDRTPTFTRHGRFSARAAYSAGHGSCCVIPGNQVPAYCAAFPVTFNRSTASAQPVGAMRFQCSGTLAEPCDSTADCLSGTCATSGPPSKRAYFFLVSDSSSSVDVYVSEVE